MTAGVKDCAWSEVIDVAIHAHVSVLISLRFIEFTVVSFGLVEIRIDHAQCRSIRQILFMFIIDTFTL